MIVKFRTRINSSFIDPYFWLFKKR